MWIPKNYRSKSASKDKDGDAFKYIKRKGGKKSSAKIISGFKEIKKLK